MQALGYGGKRPMRLRNLIPKSTKEQLRRLEAVIRSFRFACPLCRRRVGTFLTLSQALPELAADLSRHGFDMQLFERAETLNLTQYACPWCRANDRSRLYALFLLDEAKRIGSGGKPRMLDIGPAEKLRIFVRGLECFDYRSADLLRSDVDDRIDLTDMRVYADNSFDCFICSHVLEHVPDDRKGMRELFRILKPGGWGIAMAPIILGLKATSEDANLPDPAERVRRFGQDDHLRLYARQDFIDRLSDAGFQISQLGMTHFGRDKFTKYGITETSVLYICRKKSGL
jgi:SAM-dependent methyltransferase